MMNERKELIKHLLTENKVVGVEIERSYLELTLDNGETITVALGINLYGEIKSTAVQHRMKNGELNTLAILSLSYEKDKEPDKILN